MVTAAERAANPSAHGSTSARKDSTAPSSSRRIRSSYSTIMLSPAGPAGAPDRQPAVAFSMTWLRIVTAAAVFVVWRRPWRMEDQWTMCDSARRA
jgi:hypothetical protein